MTILFTIALTSIVVGTAGHVLEPDNYSHNGFVFIGFILLVAGLLIVAGAEMQKWGVLKL